MDIKSDILTAIDFGIKAILLMMTYWLFSVFVSSFIWLNSHVVGAQVLMMMIMIFFMWDD